MTILSFPSNTFKQEPLDPEGLEQYTRTKFGARFFISEKIEVNGLGTHPVYAFLRQNSSLANKKAKQGEPQVGEIPWNYAKFLVDAKGAVIKFYEPS